MFNISVSFVALRWNWIWNKKNCPLSGFAWRLLITIMMWCSPPNLSCESLKDYPYNTTGCSSQSNTTNISINHLRFGGTSSSSTSTDTRYITENNWTTCNKFFNSTRVININHTIMGSVWKRLQRVNKRAAKFQFTASYHELRVETTAKWWVFVVLHKNFQ